MRKAAPWSIAIVEDVVEVEDHLETLMMLHQLLTVRRRAVRRPLRARESPCRPHLPLIPATRPCQNKCLEMGERSGRMFHGVSKVLDWRPSPRDIHFEETGDMAT